MGSSASVVDQRQLYEQCRAQYVQSECDVRDFEAHFNQMQEIYESWQKSIVVRDSVILSELTSLESNLESAFQTGLTPLIVDSSDDDKVCTFFSYQPDAIILEAKSMVLEGTKLPLVNILEKARRTLVNAMKHGKLLVIRLGTAAPDFMHTFNDESISKDSADKNRYFPLEVFQQGGKLLHDDCWIEKLFREEDMKPHRNFAICR